MRLRLVLAIGVVGCLSLPAAAYDLVVPVVLDVRAGTAHYLTELTLTNRGTAPLEAALTYEGSLGTGAGMVTEILAAGSQRTIPDVVAYLAARGVPFPAPGDGAPRAGTLRIALPGLPDGTVSALARTTSPTAAPHPSGAAGLAYLAVPASAERYTVVEPPPQDPLGEVGHRQQLDLAVLGVVEEHLGALQARRRVLGIRLGCQLTVEARVQRQTLPHLLGPGVAQRQ